MNEIEEVSRTGLTSANADSKAKSAESVDIINADWRIALPRAFPYRRFLHGLVWRSARSAQVARTPTTQTDPFNVR